MLVIMTLKNMITGNLGKLVTRKGIIFRMVEMKLIMAMKKNVVMKNVAERKGARGSVVGSGATLQARRSRV
jgi:hypothetical protein